MFREEKVHIVCRLFVVEISSYLYDKAGVDTTQRYIQTIFPTKHNRTFRGKERDLSGSLEYVVECVLEILTTRGNPPLSLRHRGHMQISESGSRVRGFSVLHFLGRNGKSLDLEDVMDAGEEWESRGQSIWFIGLNAQLTRKASQESRQTDEDELGDGIDERRKKVRWAWVEAGWRSGSRNFILQIRSQKWLAPFTNKSGVTKELKMWDRRKKA